MTKYQPMTGTEGQGVPIVPPLPDTIVFNSLAGKHRERGGVSQFDRHGPWSAPLPYSCVLLGLGHTVGAGRSILLSSASAGRQQPRRRHSANGGHAGAGRYDPVTRANRATSQSGLLPTISTSQLAGLSFGTARPFFWRVRRRSLSRSPCPGRFSQPAAHSPKERHVF